MMADEIIKLIEYTTENPIIQGAFVAYVVIGAMIATMAIAIILFVFRQILKNKREWRR